MIGEAAIDIVFKIISGFLNFLPDVSWDPGGAAVSFIGDCCASVCYLLPMGAVKGIVSVIVTFTIFKAVISLIKTIWDLLPIV